MNLKLNSEFQAHRLGILVPTYNHEKTLSSLLEELLQYTDRIVVVNDGSTDATTSILKRYPNLHIIEYSVNRGKGMALRIGFSAARALGYENLITIDSDGQHFPEDLYLFIKALDENPSSLILGSRYVGEASITGKRSFGNRLSNFLFWVQTGKRLPDTQSGYRLYPVEKYLETRFFSTQFEFEIEVLVRSAWSGIPIHTIPVKTDDATAGTRIGQFSLLKNFSRISLLNTCLTIIGILYIIPRDFLRNLNRANLRRWTAKYLLVPGEKDSVKALSIGFGVFMGIFPIWGFQILVALALSFVFRLNKVLVLLASNISFPPLIPLIILVSHWIGGFWLGKKAVSIDFSSGGNPLDLIKLHYFQYFIGAVTFAVSAGLAAGGLVFVLLTMKRAKVV